MKNPSQRNPRSPIISVMLLALLCVGGMELAFCAHFSPELYHKITDPVVQPVVRAVNSAKAQLRQWEFELRLNRVLAEVVELSSEYRQPRPVYFPERPQYILHPELLEPPPEPAEPAITEFIEEDGRTILTGTNPVVYFNQGDPAWRDKPFGTDYIGKYACGPTVMAMVVATLTDTDTDPAKMAVWAYEHGYWCSGSGSFPSIIEGTSKAFGIDCREAKDCDPGALRAHLRSGGLAVALVGPGHFTDSGHFILIHGCSLSGEVLVADPNSRDNSLALWDPRVILSEARASNGDGVCVWLIG
ncbi:C39 family peptidase [Acutalibacter sp. 1XD8-36]|uniref:C39 family peptidase n=1 Tax=Acutalibacter sp. 1XD8-36 TaxID=2320852 RepID=UPI00263787AC|nr:C39 family peptidase [Acutalibacter sp. 1XD8-36]